jgi:hypothetical protein
MIIFFRFKLRSWYYAFSSYLTSLRFFSLKKVDVFLDEFTDCCIEIDLSTDLPKLLLLVTEDVRSYFFRPLSFLEKDILFLSLNEELLYLLEDVF